MNKKIRCMVDEIFADMKMTAENLALRDELMANAIARYEDSISAGKTEEDAFAEVAASLDDVRSTLEEMDGEEYTEVVVEATETEPGQNGNDVGEVIEKAFGAIGDFGKKIIPQVGKLAQQADEAAGGAFSGFGKAVGKGAVEVGRVAGETFEKISKNISDSVKKKELTADELLERAREIRIQAEIKQEADDQEGARDLRRKAYEMEMQAEALIQAEQIRMAQEEAAETENETAADETETEEAITAEAAADVAEEAERILEEVEKAEHEQEGIHLGSDQKDVVVINRFDAAAIRRMEIGLDSDDIELLTTAESAFEVKWSSGSAQSTQPEITVNEGVLTISRKNPDVFKTFFSVFKKEGGKLTVSVPAGLLLSYKVSTTSGDITAYGIDVEDGRFNSTSGRIRIETDERQIAGAVSVNTVSGRVEIRTNSESVGATTVSGKLTVEGRADRLCANTVSGKIKANGAFNECMVDSVSGDASIVCAAVPQDKVKISTLSGSARLVLPADISGFKVESSSISGGVLNDFGPNRYGTCALPIRFDSMSGKLSIVKSVG